jgi:hypothetical protein
MTCPRVTVRKSKRKEPRCHRVPLCLRTYRAKQRLPPPPNPSPQGSEFKDASENRLRNFNRLSAEAKGVLSAGCIWVAPVRADGAVNNNLVGGSSPPRPPTQSSELADFPETAKEPAVGGLLRLRFRFPRRPFLT